MAFSLRFLTGLVWQLCPISKAIISDSQKREVVDSHLRAGMSTVAGVGRSNHGGALGYGSVRRGSG